MKGRVVVEKVSKFPGVDGELICVCGNTPYSHGFEPCTRDGTVVEPTIEGPWDGRLYVCGKCHRIVDQESLDVVGRA